MALADHSVSAELMEAFQAEFDSIINVVSPEFDKACGQTNHAAYKAIRRAPQQRKARTFDDSLQCLVDRLLGVQQKAIDHLQELAVRFTVKAIQLPPLIPNLTFPRSGNQKLDERVTEIITRVGVPKEIEEELRRLRPRPDPGGRLQTWLEAAFEVLWEPLRPGYYFWIIKAFVRKPKTPADLIAPEWLWKIRSPEGLSAYRRTITARAHAKSSAITVEPIGRAFRQTATKQLLEYVAGEIEKRLTIGRQEAFEKAFLAIRSKSPFVAEAKSTIQEPQAALGDSIIPEEQQPQAEPQTTVAKPKPLSLFDLFAGQLLYEARQKFGQKLRRGPNRQPRSRIGNPPSATKVFVGR